MKLRIVYTLFSIVLLSSTLHANCSEADYKSYCITSIDSSTPFITIWITELEGVSADNQILIPGIGENYSIYWEEIDHPENRDSTIGNNTTLITFPNPGIYSVSITPGTGTFHRIYFNDEGDKSKILTIIQWGDIEWSSFEGAFSGCINLYLNLNPIDLPNLSNVTDLSRMFYGCIELNGPINIGEWNVDNVTTMSLMFYFARSFNQNISKWNVDNVTTMSWMFYYAKSFNQDIGIWNVAKVKDMSNLFYDASLFNQDISRWNVGNVTNMRSMFNRADSFNQNIGDWDVSNVTNMAGMFVRASSFNQDISNWNVANVANMRSMFFGANSFNQNIGSWNIINVTDIGSMLNESGIECDNYSATLIGWNNNPTTPNSLRFGADGLQYGTEAETARDNLISSKGWTISGDSPSGVNCLMSVSTNNTELSSQIKLFPNPFNNHLIVEFSGDEQVTIVLYDQLSRRVVQQTFYKSATIDPELLPQGLYIYELTKNNQIISSGKIVKK